jgi:hypothetical protein
MMLRTGQEQCDNFPEGPNYYCWVEQGYDSGPVFEARITGVFVSDCSLFGVGQADTACSLSDECMRQFIKALIPPPPELVAEAHNLVGAHVAADHAVRQPGLGTADPTMQFFRA